MDARKTGVTYGKEEMFSILQKGNKALGLVGEESRMELLPELDKALQAFRDRVPFQVSILRPETFGQFLALDNPTQPLFNQLVSEIPWWDLLDQIEETCFLQSSAVEKARPFLDGPWGDEKAKNPFKPPAGWKYLPAEEAVEAYQKLYGSSLDGSKTIKRAQGAKPRQESEGVACWPTLTKLAQIFGVGGNPLGNTKEGLTAYARVINHLIDEVVGPTYTKAYPDFGFYNWHEGELSAQHVQLTSAARKTWQRLEDESKDDFVLVPHGAVTGSLYAGHSVRRSRILIVLAGNQFGQDAVMVGNTLAIQPDRLTKYEDLWIDCPGTRYAPDADGQFSYSPYFDWHDGRLRFGTDWADSAARYFGSASGSIQVLDTWIL